MSIYISCTFIILFLNILNKTKVINRKNYCWIIGLIIFLISGLRGNYVGVDTSTYIDIFNRIAVMPWSEVLFYEDLEVGYVVLNKITSIFCTNHRLLFILIAALFSFAISNYIYKYSPDLGLSYLIVFAFNFIQFSMTGLRQTIALSLVILSLMQVYKRKEINAVIMIIIASLFHKSALISILFILLNKIKFNINRGLLGIFLLLISFVFNDKIGSSIIKVMDYKDYEVSLTGGGESILLVMLLLFIAGVFFLKDYKRIYLKYYSFEYYLLLIACFFQTLVPVQNVFFRIAMYFSIVLTIYIPKLVYGIDNKNFKQLAIYMMYCFILIQYLVFTIRSAGVVPYQFFWK